MGLFHVSLRERARTSSYTRITMRTATIAALQIGSQAAGTAATLDRILSYANAIRDAGAQLVVMPEALLGGYPKGADFGARVGYRTPEGRDAFLQYWREAIDVPGPQTDALGELARNDRLGARRRRDRARHDDALLHGSVLLRARRARRQASQARADCDGAPDLGPGRRLDAVRDADRCRPGRRLHLLGKHDAAAADRDVREGPRHLVRADRRRARHVAGEHAAHRVRRPLVRRQRVPVSAAAHRHRLCRTGRAIVR